VWWSRRSFRKAGERQVKREKKVEEERLGKAEIKGFRASNIFFNKKLAEKRCVERERECVRKRRGRKRRKRRLWNAPKNNNRSRRKIGCTHSKLCTTAQKGKRMALNKATSKDKRVKRCTGDASGGQGEESSQAPPPTNTRRGRYITVPKKSR
jgi:hypothetical protein